MSKTTLSLLVALSALALPAAGAFAHDEYSAEHIVRDGYQVDRARAQVYEERNDVYVARRGVERAERYGNRRDVARAQAHLNEEVREYYGARNKYLSKRNDYIADREEYNEGYRPHRRHWWRWN